MRVSDVEVPQNALDHRTPPLDGETRWEYAVEAGGFVLNHKRYATPDDARLYGCVLADAVDKERYGHIMLQRRVVKRRVVYGEWKPVNFKREETK